MSSSDDRAIWNWMDDPDYVLDWVRVMAPDGHWYFVRPGGYRGAPTAELMPMSFGWLASSWIVQPARSALLSRHLSLREAIDTLKTAEDEGQKSSIWLPREALDLESEKNRGLQWRPGNIPRYQFIFDSYASCLIYEVQSGGGITSFAVVFNGDIVTEDDGNPCLFDTIKQAQDFAVEKEGVKWWLS
jgi:hypothetical protein